jgi:hypothetical protein
MRGALLVMGALLVALGSAGCSDSAESPEAVADRFEELVSQQDGTAACALLAEATIDELEQSAGKPCPEALLEEAKDGGPRVEASRYGTMAQVRYRDDVLFLTRGPDGWRVLAAACRASHGAPYDCAVSGG